MLNKVLSWIDVRTHPPLRFAFPPSPLKPQEDPVDHSDVTDSDPDDDAKDAIIADPSGRRRLSSQTASTLHPSQSNDSMSEESRFLSMRSLIRGVSPYVSLDGDRLAAFSPSPKATFASPSRSSTILATETSLFVPSNRDAANGPAIGDSSTSKSRLPTTLKNRLPNATLNIDLRSLNLHLAIRTSEILACSESMWEWVLTYQKEVRAQKAEQQAKSAPRARSGSLPVDEPPKKQSSLFGTIRAEKPTLKSLIYDLTREDFDNLLGRFEM